MRKGIRVWVHAVGLSAGLASGLGAQTFPITIDARGLSPFGMVVSAEWTLTNESPETFSLPAGEHSLSYEGGGAEAPSVVFTVTESGTVDYAVELDGVLSGRGGITLEVLGVAVTVDLSPLSPEDVYFFGAADYIATEAASYRLLPGFHLLHYNGGGPELSSQPQTGFTVTASGGVAYEPELEGILLGAGTATVTVQGIAVTLDLNPLSPPNVFFYGATAYVATEQGEHRLLPGSHRLLYDGGDPDLETIPQVDFTVTLSGEITYDPALEGILRLAGPRTLEVHGAAIRIDLSRLAPPEVHFYGAGDFVASAVHDFRLFPGAHRVHYSDEGSDLSTAPQVSFAVASDGSVVYDPILEGILTGAGSNELTVNGIEVRIACGDINVAPQPIVVEGTASESCSRLRLLPGIHQVSSACGAETVAVTLRTDGILDYAPELDDRVDGRGTAVLAFRGADGSPADCALDFAVGGVDSFVLTPELRDQLYKVRVPPGESLLDRVIEVRLEGEAGDENALFARWGRPATPAAHDLSALGPGVASPELVVGPGRDQSLYVLVQTNVLAGGSSLVTLRIEECPAGLALERFSSGSVAEDDVDARVSGVATGAGFDASTAFALEPEGAEGAAIPAAGAVVASGGRAELVFDLAGARAGLYDLTAREGEVEARIPRAFEVRSTSTGAVLAIEVEAFSEYPHCEDARLTLRYRNVGDRELAAPLLRITASGGTDVWLEGEQPCPRDEPAASSCRGNVVLALAHSGDGVPGRLAPGAEGSLRVYFRKGVCLEPACEPVDACLRFQVDRLDLSSARRTPIPWAELSPPPASPRRTGSGSGTA